MPMEYSIDEDLGVVFTTASDVLAEEELLEHKRRVLTDPKFKPGFDELSDVRFIADLAISAAGLERFVAADDSASERLEGYGWPS